MVSFPRVYPPTPYMQRSSPLYEKDTSASDTLWGWQNQKDNSLNFRTRFKYTWLELSLYRCHSVNMYYTRVKLVFTYRSVQD